MLKKLTVLFMVAWLVAACGSGAPSTPAPGQEAPTSAAPGELRLVSQWKNNERFEYQVLASQDGSNAGSGVVEIRLASDATTIEQTYQFGEVTQHMLTQIHPQNLRPISGLLELSGTPNAFTLTSEYRDGKLSVKAKTADGEKSATGDIAVDAIDNDSALMVLRNLPLGDGFSVPFNNAVASGAAQVQATLTVTGRETVSVPAGTFETYKVQLSFGGGQPQMVWYEVAAPHRMIQYDNGSTKFVLIKSS